MPNVRVIEAREEQAAMPENQKKKRVAAYCRVSTDHEDQETSFEGQQNLHNSSEDNPLCN